MTPELILIPSAGELPTELAIEFGQVPSVLLPLGGKPLIRWLLARYRSGPVSVVVERGNAAPVLDAVPRRYRSQLRISEIPCSTSLAESIAFGLLKYCEEFIEGPLAVTINLGDTLLDEDLPTDAIAVAEVVDPWRWTTASLKAGQVVFGDKGAHDRPPDNLACVGVFRVGDARRFSRLLCDAIARKTSTDAFYEAIAHYSRDRPVSLHRVHTWKDLGHLDSFFEARRTLLQSREFNNLVPNHDTSTLIKRSRQVSKLRAEASWFTQVPPNLQSLTPRIFSYHESIDSGFPQAELEMEYYGYPSLAEAFVYFAWDRATWARVAATVRTALQRLSEHEQVSDRATRIAALEEHYVDRLMSRLVEFRETEQGSALASVRSVNGITITPLDELMISLRDMADRSGVLEDRPFTVMHGDLCFNNMLFDRRTQALKLIDPRGSFGPEGIYGDPLYEYAKLTHSVVSGYDLIIADRYSANLDTNGAAQLDIPWTHNQLLVRDMFESAFPRLRRLGSLDHFLQANLFLGMLPLHSEDTSRQFALGCIGLVHANFLAA